MKPLDYIKNIRKITITAAAKELGYSRVQVSNLCNGKIVGRKLADRFIRWSNNQVSWSDIYQS